LEEFEPEFHGLDDTGFTNTTLACHGEKHLVFGLQGGLPTVLDGAGEDFLHHQELLCIQRPSTVSDRMEGVRVVGNRKVVRLFSVISRILGIFTFRREVEILRHRGWESWCCVKKGYCQRHAGQNRPTYL
jgi:hypothetical protein